MSDLVLKQCPICFEAIPLRRVAFFKCGHKTCSECHSKRVKLKNLSCVVCRKEIEENPRKIFLSSDELEIVEGKAEEPRPANEVLEGLRKISMDTPVTSLAKASEKVMKLQRINGDDPTMAVALVNALRDLDQRITPNFARLAECEEINGHLQGRIQELESSQRKYAAKVKQVKHELQTEQEEAERQRRRAEKYLKLLKNKEGEFERELEEKTREISLRKKKMKALLREQKHHRQPSEQDLDASLLVDDPEPLKDPSDETGKLSDDRLLKRRRTNLGSEDAIL